MKAKLLVLNRLRQTLTLFIFISIVGLHGTYAQNTVSISGKVVDAADKLEIPGVNILEKGTTNGTSTDFDGAFKFNVKSSNATIVVSYIGYKTQTIELKGRTTITIELAQDQQALEEVVLVGYGTVRKSDLTGAVSTLSGADLQKQPISNVAEGLTGRIAGVSVTSTEGSPDSEISVRIRGGGSLTQDASPLIIVDGFPVNSLNDISPSDIENMTFLKDASSTAIYGSRGAYGVILVTTKSGKSGEKVSVTYDMFTGVKKIAKTLDVLNPADYAKWQYEYAVLADDLPSYEEFFGTYSEIGQYQNVENTNWQKEIYGRTGTVQSHSLGVRGGSEKTNYNFNYTHFDEQAIMIGSSFKRNNLSLNLKSKISEKLQLNLTMRYSDTKINGGGANEQREFSSTDSRLKHSIGYSPFPIPGLVDDEEDEATSGYLINPFRVAADNDRLQKRKNINLLGGITWKITKDIQFKSDFGIDNYKYEDFRFYGATTYYVRNAPATENQGLPALIFSIREDNRFRNANTLNIDFKRWLGEKHQLKLLLGQESIIYKSNQLTNTLHGYPADFTFQNTMNLTTIGLPQSVNNFSNPDDKLLSFFGRVNYDINNKYLLTATFRADGSSKFLNDNVWGYFPSAAVAWKISEENFLKDISWLDLLKVRLSYGQSGNNNIPNGQTIQNYFNSNTGAPWINDLNSYWAASNVLANPDLKWETTVTQNIGLDYEFLKGRLSGSFEYYDNITTDLLNRFEIGGTGYTYQYRNMGEVENKGYEATLNIAAIRKENYGLNFSLNMSVNKNRINSIGDMENYQVPTSWNSGIGTDFAVWEGHPIGSIYGYQNAGRYEVSDFTFENGVYTLNEGIVDSAPILGNAVQPGSMKLKDTNGDGVISADDRSIIGDVNPKHTGGFTINANAYNFDLSAAFNWSYGNDVYNATKLEHSTATISNPNGQYRNLLTNMADGVRWTNIDPATGDLVTDPTALAALNANTTMWSPYMNNFVVTDWVVEDGSFLRLNTLTLGYSFPESLIEKLGITRLRLYGTATNVFILTNYSGLDPEVSTRRQTSLTPGVDYSPYPRSRQFVFGLNVNF